MAPGGGSVPTSSGYERFSARSFPREERLATVHQFRCIAAFAEQNRSADTKGKPATQRSSISVRTLAQSSDRDRRRVQDRNSSQQALQLVTSRLIHRL